MRLNLSTALRKAGPSRFERAFSRTRARGSEGAGGRPAAQLAAVARRRLKAGGAEGGRSSGLAESAVVLAREERTAAEEGGAEDAEGLGVPARGVLAREEEEDLL